MHLSQEAEKQREYVYVKYLTLILSHRAERIPFRKPWQDPPSLLLYLGHCICVRDSGAIGDGGGGCSIWEGGRGSVRLTNKYAKLLSFFKEEKRDLHEQYNILVCK